MSNSLKNCIICNEEIIQEANYCTECGRFQVERSDIVIETQTLKNQKVILTKKHLIIIQWGFGEAINKKIALDEILDSKYKQNTVADELIIYSKGQEAETVLKFGQDKTKTGWDINEFIRKHLKGESSDTKTQDDIPAKIKQLGELKEQGILTDEEFNQKKAELLKKI